MPKTAVPVDTSQISYAAGTKIYCEHGHPLGHFRRDVTFGEQIRPNMLTWTLPKQRSMRQKRSGFWICSVCRGAILDPHTKDFYTEQPAGKTADRTMAEAVAAARSQLFLQYCAGQSQEVEATVALALELLNQSKFCLLQVCSGDTVKAERAFGFIVAGESP